MTPAQMREHVAALDALASQLYVAIVTNPKSTSEMPGLIGQITGRLTFMRAQLARTDEPEAPR